MGVGGIPHLTLTRTGTERKAAGATGARNCRRRSSASVIGACARVSPRLLTVRTIFWSVSDIDSGRRHSWEQMWVGTMTPVRTHVPGEDAVVHRLRESQRSAAHVVIAG